jgi:stage V sporulation protein AC
MPETEFGKKRYAEMVKEASPNSKVFVNCLRAFLVGGMICGLGQIITNLLATRVAMDDAKLLTAIILIVAAVLLTGLGWYEKIAKHAGAGSIVPITGFANAIAAPAVEYKKEGMILGIGAKMFLIAGPVIVYGTVTSVIVGLIYYFMR